MSLFSFSELEGIEIGLRKAEMVDCFWQGEPTTVERRGVASMISNCLFFFIFGLFSICTLKF